MDWSEQGNSACAADKIKNRKALIALQKNPDFLRLAKSISVFKVLDCKELDEPAKANLLVNLLLSTNLFVNWLV